MAAGLEIVVAASFASAAGHGGWTWAVLQYVLGLRRLGHRVHLIDPVRPESICPGNSPLPASDNLAYFLAVGDRFDLTDQMTLLLTSVPPQTAGATYAELVDLAARSDLLINVSGVLRDEPLLGAARRRVYLDLDPAFTQLWHQVEGVDMGFGLHTDFVTIGLAIGTADCPVPTCGLPWITSPQPVVLEHWPVSPACHEAPLTTVANWRGYGSIEYDGTLYGQKAHALRALMPLPLCTSERLLLAMAIHPDETVDLEALAANRWTLVDPALVTRTPDDYRNFIVRSKGEFGVAKTGYVHSRCGWFSDRSICYLASGRPVVAQDTGVGPFVPHGEGLLGFTALDEAVAAIECLQRDYRRHARAARGLAEDCFDSDRVLPHLVERLGTIR